MLRTGTTGHERAAGVVQGVVDRRRKFSLSRINEAIAAQHRREGNTRD
jgi:hypothetical protein